MLLFKFIQLQIVRGAMLLLLFFFSISSDAQNDYDKQVFFGSLTLFDFNYNPPVTLTPITVNGANVLLDGTNACIADSVGNFQFCFQGTKVVNHKRQIMDGGTGLNQSRFEQDNSLAVFVDQCAIALPKKDNTYYLFYLSSPDSNYSNAFNVLYYAIIDMKQNNGEGKVITKQKAIVNDYLQNGTLTATRHANGRDWWLIKQQFNHYAFYVFHITPDTIYPPIYQQFASGTMNNGNIDYAVFNPQGNKIAVSTNSSANIGMQLLNFDRCTGQITAWKQLGLSQENGVWYNANVFPCFSPSGRYLYTNSVLRLNQFDLYADNIDSSKIVIDTLTTDTNGIFSNMMRGIDNKIYMDNWQTGYYKLSVIHNPDGKGINCDFHPHELLVAKNDSGRGGPAFGLPNLPNFRLGAVPSADNQQNQTIYYCAGDSITLSRKHYPYSSYRWHDGSSTLATGTLHYALRPIGNKTIYVALHDSTCSCGNRTDTIRFIAVNDTAIYHSYHTTICSTDSITIGNSYPNSRYAWYRDSTLISTADSITATAAATYIQHIIDTTLLCVTHIDTFYIDTIDCDTIPQLPIGIHFFPNPANDYIEYTINDSTLNINELQLTIVAVSGATVIQKYITNATGKIDITNLASGVYILSLTSDKQVKYRKKWVVW